MPIALATHRENKIHNPTDLVFIILPETTGWGFDYVVHGAGTASHQLSPTPGFWSMTMEFKAKVSITGNVPPYKNGETVRGYIELHTQVAETSTINKGVEASEAEVKKDLMDKQLNDLPRDALLATGNL